MPVWLRNALFAIVLLCCMVIGLRVYLEIEQRRGGESATVQTGQVSGAPETLSDFTLPDLAGEPRSISEWAGRPLLINFWATWCAPCRREIPLLQQLHTERANTGIQVVGIAIDRLPDVQAFVGEYGVSYPMLVGQQDAMAVSDRFGMDGLGLPFSVLTAGDGRILTVHVGEIDAEQLRELVAVSRAHEAGDMDTATARARLTAL